MSKYNYPAYAPQCGHMTEKIRAQYIDGAANTNLLPSNAHRMHSVITLNASNDLTRPIQFWQLYSVLGSNRIIAIVKNFYRRVYSDEQWFASVFAQVASERHHVGTQSSMWIDVMGGGHQYHGAEFRLHFHHTHNAIKLMNNKGAERWVKLMTDTLDDPELDYSDDPRVRPAINTFLTFFLGKYADEFKFENRFSFGDTNPRFIRRINFMNLTSDAIEALPEQALIDELSMRGIDVSQYKDKQALVTKALSL